MKRPTDKHGIEITVGDVLKIFHFRGARGKKHYMYKYVQEQIEHKDWKAPRYVVSHLIPGVETYQMLLDGKHYPNTEILQGVKLEEREKQPINN